MTSLAAELFDLHRGQVRPEWIDYNGHMNMAYYLVAFDHATDQVLDHFSIGEAYSRQGRGTTFAAETHVTYERELNLGDPLRVTTLILGADAKRLHMFHQMYHGASGYLAATNEVIILHVDLASRRTAPFPEQAATALAAAAAAHAGLARPPQIGRVISLARRPRPAGSAP